MTIIQGKFVRENLGKTQIITANLTKKLLKELDKFAKMHHSGNRSWAIEEILERFFATD